MKKKRSHRSRRPATVQPVVGPTLNFAAQDSHHHPKNQLWYLGIGLLLLAVLAGLLQAGEYLLMAVTVALAAAIFRLAGVRSREQQVTLSDRGVTYDDDFYAYFQLRAFWVAEHTDSVSIYIERLNVAPMLHFLVPENRAEEAVEFLMDHLPWHHHRNEPLGDRLGRLLRF